MTDRSLKIAIDVGLLADGDSVRGIGFHTRELIDHLKKLEGVEIDLVDATKADLKKYDIVHYQKFHPYFFSIPFVKSVPSVLTIHDLIYLIYPSYYPPGIKGSMRFLIQKYLARKMDAIITISETSKKDIVRFLGIPQEKIFAIHLAPREIFRPISNHQSLITVQKKFGFPNSFVLYVGDVNYNKNLLGLAKACKIAKIPLVIVGKQAVSTDFDKSHPENQPFIEFLEKYGDDKDILRIGFVPDEDLVGLYNLASLCCQPSFYEGFGLPILEAFACGCPVVAAKTQTLAEIGEPAALFCDPKDPKDIAEKISQVVNDRVLKSQLVERGKMLVKNYSWEKTAKEIFAVYQRVSE